jgi:cytochrome c553
MKNTLIALLLGRRTGRPSQAQAGERRQGRAAKAAMCIGCHGIHGYQASFPEVHKVPMISGQGAKYIAAALQAYKKGERKHPTMRGHRHVADRAGHGRPGRLLRAASKAHDQARGRAPSRRPKSAALLKKGACASCHGANFNKPIDPATPRSPASTPTTCTWR